MLQRISVPPLLTGDAQPLSRPFSRRCLSTTKNNGHPAGWPCLPIGYAGGDARIETEVLTTGADSHGGGSRGLAALTVSARPLRSLPLSP